MLSTPADPPALAPVPSGAVAVPASALRAALVHLNKCGISRARRGGASPSTVDVNVTGDAVTVRRSDGFTDVTVTVPDQGSARRPHADPPVRMRFDELADYVRKAEKQLSARDFREARVTIVPGLPGLVRVQVAGDNDGPIITAHDVPEHDRSLPLIRYPHVATWNRDAFCRDIAWARRTIAVPCKPDAAELFDQIRAEITPGHARLVSTDRYRLTLTGWQAVWTDDALVGRTSLVVLPGVVTGRVAERFTGCDADTVQLEVSSDSRVIVLECGPVRAVLRLRQDHAGPRDLTDAAELHFDMAVTMSRAELAALVEAVHAARQADPYEVPPHIGVSLAADGTVSVRLGPDGATVGTLKAAYHGFTIDPAEPLGMGFPLAHLTDALDTFTGETITMTGRTSRYNVAGQTPWPQACGSARRSPWVFTDQPRQANDPDAHRYLIMPLL